jgi:hypothetical protein
VLLDNSLNSVDISEISNKLNLTGISKSWAGCD